MSLPVSDEEAAHAEAAILESIQQWTSPKLGTVASLRSPPPPPPPTTTTATKRYRDAMDEESFHTKNIHRHGAESDTDSKRFTSGGVEEFRYEYEKDPEEWLQREEEEEKVDGMEENDTMKMPPPQRYEDYESKSNQLRMPAAAAAAATTTTAHQLSKTFHRAGTPIMSNSSNSKEGNHNNSYSSDAMGIGMDTEDATVPFNVESPWVNSTPYVQTNVRASPRPQPGQRVLPSPSQTRSTRNHVDYLRYHDAVAALLLKKRRITNQLGAVVDGFDPDAMETQVTLANTRTTNVSTGIATTAPHSSLKTSTLQSNAQWIGSHELLADVDFLESLNVHAWARHAHSEGNFWKLLCVLRSLGHAALLWDDDAASIAQQQAAIASYVQQLAVQTEKTPAALVAKLNECSATDPSKWNAPLAWRRRILIRQWFEQCFAEVLPKDAAIPRTARIDTATRTPRNGYLMRQGVYATNKDEELLQSYLLLLLAGQFTNAQALLRDSGVSWRAGVWAGGEPHDCTLSTPLENGNGEKMRNSGNPRRSLWCHTMWRHAAQLGQDPASSANEAAITALLSSNVNVALDCSKLRTWDRAMYALWRGWTDRTVDELLYAHNNNRRRLNPPFPGTECERSEVQHLKDTAMFVGMNEATVVGVLDSSPFEEMRYDGDWVLQATATVLVGKSVISRTMERSVHALHATGGQARLQDEELRFLTHLALFWFTLSTDTTSVVVDGASIWKDELLLEYVHHLACREDLWHMIVLYASFLPINEILRELPRMLLGIESDTNRRVIVNQLVKYLPEPGLELEILQQVVSLALSETEDSSNRETDVISRLDIRKMKSILWLGILEDHEGAALMAANTLLRQFLLSFNKVESASMLVNDVLDDFLAGVVAHDETAMSQDDETGWSIRHREQVKLAQNEQIAFLKFLEALKAVDTWQKRLGKSKWSFPDWSTTTDHFESAQMSQMERTIAIHAEQRKRVELIRKESQAVVKAADDARHSLRLVLEHPGGWLLTEDEKVMSEEESLHSVIRLDELERLRRKWLPYMVMGYHDVCVKTAHWMSTTIDNGLETLGHDLTSKDVILLIEVSAPEDNDNDVEQSPISPGFWSRKALEVAVMIENDVYSIRSVFDTLAYKTLVQQLAETAVTDLKYSAALL